MFHTLYILNKLFIHINISFKLFQSYFYYYILHNLGSVVMKIPGVYPKDDLCDNCCCTPCFCTITKDLLDVETMFTTIEPSKGVKQCLESDKRTEGVKCVYNQIVNVCHP